MGTQNVICLIEYLREKMVKTAEQTGELGHRDVIQLSQQLDLILLQKQLHQSNQICAETPKRDTRTAGTVHFDIFPLKREKVLERRTY